MTTPISLLCMIITLAMTFCAPVSLMGGIGDTADSAAKSNVSFDADGMDMVEHTSVTGGLKYSMPDDMVVINGASKEDLLDKVDAELIMDTYGMDEQGVSDMLDYVLEEDCSEYDLIYTADFFGMLHITRLPDFGITPDDLPDAKKDLDELNTDYYIDLGASEDDCVTHGIVTVGDNPGKWYKFSAAVDDISYVTYMTCSESGDMFSFDFCDVPEETALAIIESVELPDADAAPSKEKDAQSEADAKPESDAKSDAEAAGSMDYTSVTGLFACRIPDDMILLNGASKEDFLDKVDAGLVMEDWDIGEDAFYELIDYILEEDCSYYDVIYTANLMGSLSIECMPDYGITAEQLPSAQNDLSQSLTEFYMELGADEEDCVSHGMVEVGESQCNWYKFSADIGSDFFATYTTCSSSGDMIYVDVHNVPEEQAIAVIESIELTED